MVEILNEYSWSHLAILYDQDYVFFNLAGSQLAIDLKGIESLPRPVDIPFSATKLKDPGSLLQEASQFARCKSYFILVDSNVDKSYVTWVSLGEQWTYTCIS